MYIPVCHYLVKLLLGFRLVFLLNLLICKMFEQLVNNTSGVPGLSRQSGFSQTTRKCQIGILSFLRESKKIQ